MRLVHNVTRASHWWEKVYPAGELHCESRTLKLVFQSKEMYFILWLAGLFKSYVDVNDLSASLKPSASSSKNIPPNCWAWKNLITLKKKKTPASRSRWSGEMNVMAEELERHQKAYKRCSSKWRKRWLNSTFHLLFCAKVLMFQVRYAYT